jgi:dTMP kinase
MEKMKLNKGLKPFITFEGIEGCGKTTQIIMLGEYLQKKGRPFLITREPGGTSIGESLREILLDSRNRSISNLTELFLIEAIRHQHVEEVLRPSLIAGKVILCDRFSDATIAYQHFGRGIDRAIIEKIDYWATGGLKPSLTILLDCPVEEGLRRSLKRLEKEGKIEGESRFEQEGLSFHLSVREGYLELARNEPERIKVMDGSKPPEKIHMEIIDLLKGWIDP